VWVRVGARDEPAESAGVSHFLEHLLFKGTPTRSRRQIDEGVDRVGGELNAFTSKEYTAYYARLPARHFGMGLELLADVLTHPLLRDHDVETERQVILEELAMDADTPDDRVHTLLYEALFPGHALGRETAGEERTVEAITADDVRAFFARWYRPENFVVAAAGPVDHEHVVEAVTRWFDGATGEGAPTRVAPTDTPIAPLSVERRSTEQVHLTVGYRALDRDDPDREALDVLNHVLGGGMSSRLFEEIREQRGLAYSVFSAPASYTDAGTLTVYAGTGEEHVAEVLGLIDTTLEGLVQDGITADELDVAVGSLTGSFVLGLEGTGARMGRIGGQVCTLDRVVPVVEQIARYEALTLDDVQRVAHRVLGGPRSLAAVGPVTKKTLQPFARPLAR
jgi:predicted Zn-dependent peptidase